MQTDNMFSSSEQRLMALSKIHGIPAYGILELSPLCNMNCRMCYVRLSVAEQQEIAPLLTVSQWLDIAGQLRNAGTVFLLLTGGEPLLYPGFRELYLALRKMGFIVSVNTNGTLINEDWADFFGNNKPRRLNISLYGASEETYRTLCNYPEGFSKVIRAVRMLRERDVLVKLSGSIAAANHADAEKIIAIGKSLQVPVKLDPYMVPAERERPLPFSRQSRIPPEEAGRLWVFSVREEYDDKSFGQLRESALQKINTGGGGGCGLSCNACSCSFAISWNGMLRPCVTAPGPLVHVRELGFAKAWKELRSAAQNIRLNQRCVTCSLRPVCQTCPMSAYVETGSYDGIPEYCCRYAGSVYANLKGES